MGLVGRVASKVRTVGRLLRNDRERLVSILRGDVRLYPVHSAALGDLPPADAREDAETRRLTVEDISEIAARYPDLAYQMDQVQEFGESSAWGVFLNGRLATICWMITPDLDKKRYLQLVKLRPGEIEIARAFTMPEFRGQGLYPFAIRSVCAAAREAGMHTVFMITDRSNAVSRRGIEKAGLRRSGHILSIQPPIIGTILHPIVRTFR